MPSHLQRLKKQKPLTRAEYEHLSYILSLAYTWHVDFFLGPEQSGETDKNPRTKQVDRAIARARKILNRLEPK
jgi:hypothetical protein